MAPSRTVTPSSRRHNLPRPDAFTALAFSLWHLVGDYALEMTPELTQRLLLWTPGMRCTGTLPIYRIISTRYRWCDVTETSHGSPLDSFISRHAGSRGDFLWALTCNATLTHTGDVADMVVQPKRRELDAEHPIELTIPTDEGVMQAESSTWFLRALRLCQSLGPDFRPPLEPTIT